MTVLLAAVSTLAVLLLVAAGLADEAHRDAITACWYEARYAVTAGEFAHGAVLAAAAITISAVAFALCAAATLAAFACAASAATVCKISSLQETTTHG